jgi:FixJ family two-component response regulator
VQQKTFTVYVVDDDESIRRALKRLLRSVGYHTLTFGSAEAFLEFPLGENEGCLVLDVRLPGMTGFELQEKLSLQGAMVPILFMTAHDNPQWQERAKKAGAVAYLKKPFLEQQLFDAIRLCSEKQV